MSENESGDGDHHHSHDSETDDHSRGDGHDSDTGDDRLGYGSDIDDHHRRDSDTEDHHHSHDHHHHDVETLGFAVVTVSSTRSLDDDPAGDAIAAAFEAAGHELATRELVSDNYDGVQGAVNRLVSRDDTDVVVTTGGTGVTPDDVTVGAVEPILEKELPGFGELFRRLSYDEIGTRVIGTRATAGVTDGVPVFCLPGSENAARLGAEEIIVPEAGHLTGLATREEDGENDEN
ncbi:MogA/MoaB family molybdenum cofactor biosynthesis protein [Haloprofundus salinisoli]|uniref:MogA/MoaB family molybdenum cofactor biosynthesis protein n=1 Tax=Haloprofundus salinisoli TaxID=2876193 RepID=UPI001CD014C2|nr:molybdenum cofactor synthesis domain-containing protein [Haloprofundus salinisoli]